ncbi:MAG: FtsX-like permease family protein [Gemmatimonadaceae bacterium]
MHELGVRVALGASGSAISKMVIREGLWLAGVGAVIGVVVSLFAGRLVTALATCTPGRARRSAGRDAR